MAFFLIILIVLILVFFVSSLFIAKNEDEYLYNLNKKDC